jgi:hypothetical protein
VLIEEQEVGHPDRFIRPAGSTASNHAAWSAIAERSRFMSTGPVGVLGKTVGSGLNKSELTVQIDLRATERAGRSFRFANIVARCLDGTPSTILDLAEDLPDPFQIWLAERHATTR